MTKKQLQLTALAITFFSNFATKTMFIGRLFSKSPFVSSAVTGTLGVASYHKAFSNTQAAVVLAASAGDGAPMPLNLPIKHQPTMQDSYTESATETNSSPSFSRGSVLQNNGIAIAALVVGAASLAYTYYTTRKLKDSLQFNRNLIETNRNELENATKSDVNKLIELLTSKFEESKAHTNSAKDELAGKINALESLTKEQHAQMLNEIGTLKNLTEEQKNELIELLNSKFEESKAHINLTKDELIKRINETEKSVTAHSTSESDRIIRAILTPQANLEPATTESVLHRIMGGRNLRLVKYNHNNS
jgi:hypothetical protein